MPRSQIKQRPVNPSVQLPALKPQPSFLPTNSTSFGQIVKEGIGFGAGSEIGHRIIGTILSNTVPKQSTETPTVSKCSNERNSFEVCLKTKTQEDQCNNEFLAYTQCIHTYSN